MRLIIGLCCLAYSIHLVRDSMTNLSNQSVGKMLLALPFLVVTYILLRKIIFGPLELYGCNFFVGGTTKVNKFDSRFKEVEKLIAEGKLKSALEALDVILKKYPKFKQAQIRKIQLLANNFYEVKKALVYSKEILDSGSFNRDRMDVLIIITAMLRKQGFAGEASNLTEHYKQKARGKSLALIEKMEENWAWNSRSH